MHAFPMQLDARLHINTVSDKYTHMSISQIDSSTWSDYLRHLPSFATLSHSFFHFSPTVILSYSFFLSYTGIYFPFIFRSHFFSVSLIPPFFTHRLYSAEIVPLLTNSTWQTSMKHHISKRAATQELNGEAYTPCNKGRCQSSVFGWPGKRLENAGAECYLEENAGDGR